MDRYKHKKRGTEYDIRTFDGILQSDIALQDQTKITIYRDDDGNYYARATTEFTDGRYQNVTPPPDPYEYITMSGPRKACYADWLDEPEWEKEGWEPDPVDDFYRGEYSEHYYYRRLKVDEEGNERPPSQFHDCYNDY